MTESHHGTKSYTLRRIDEKLWKRVRARALEDDITVKALLEELLQGYADGRIELTMSSSVTPDMIV